MHKYLNMKPLMHTWGNRNANGIEQLEKTATKNMQDVNTKVIFMKAIETFQYNHHNNRTIYDKQNIL